MSKVIKQNHPSWNYGPRSAYLVAFPSLQDAKATMQEAEAGAGEFIPELPAPVIPTPEETVADLMAQAHQDVDILLRQAEARAAEIVAAARDQGYTDGLNEGTSQGLAQWDERFARLEAEAEALRFQRDALLVELEQELLLLSVDIARKVLKQELVQNPDAVLAVVQSSLRRVKDREVTVWVHPDDLERVRNARTMLVEATNGASELEVFSDRRVEPGGCVLETSGSALDAKLETQLEVLETLMSQELEGSGHDALD